MFNVGFYPVTYSGFSGGFKTMPEKKAVLEIQHL